jgi:hypothetical protein
MIAARAGKGGGAGGKPPWKTALVGEEELAAGERVALVGGLREPERREGRDVDGAAQ